MARAVGAIVVVVVETGCGEAEVVVAEVVVAVVVAEVVVVVVAEAAEAAEAVAEARIQHRTPRLRPRAPSTPAELEIPGLVMNLRDIRLSTPYP